MARTSAGTRVAGTYLGTGALEAGDLLFRDGTRGGTAMLLNDIGITPAAGAALKAERHATPAST